MTLQREDAVSIEEFVTALLKAAGIVVENQDGIGYGYRRGWLQEQDAKERLLPLTKKQCARIVHEFLRCEQKEPDELDSGPAGRLQDLFDCRVCAGHVMQVYTKGIMDGVQNEEGRYIFGMEKYISNSDIEQIIDRVFRKEQRTPRVSEVGGRQAEQIPVSSAMVLMGQERNVMLVDVRSEKEYYEGHLEKAIHYPMMDIIKNPYVVSERRDVHIILYCGKGYMSETAAQSLVHAGYEKVSYFALEAEYRDEIN